VGSCTLLNTNRSILELEGGIYVQGLSDHKALTVIIIYGDEIETESCIARHRPGRIARQDIDFAGLQSGKPILGRQRYKFYFRRIVEYCRRYGTAVIDIESGPIALRVGHTKASQHAIRAANELTAVLNRFERLRACRLRAKRQYECNGKSLSQTFHDRVTDRLQVNFAWLFAHGQHSPFYQ